MVVYISLLDINQCEANIMRIKSDLVACYMQSVNEILSQCLLDHDPLRSKTLYLQISLSLEVAILDVIIILLFRHLDRHLGSAAAEVPAKFQSDWKSLNPNLGASSLHEFLRLDVLPLSG